MMKPKNNSKNPARDMCQTPDYALDPLLPYLKPEWCAWESACGEYYLSNALRDKAVSMVIATDQLYGHDYFSYEPDRESYDVQITNPPFSKKYPWLRRAYELGKPFALLMPADSLYARSANALFEKYGTEIIIMNPRINFKMPNKGWDSRANFSTAWFTWGLNIGKVLTFATVTLREQTA